MANWKKKFKDYMLYGRMENISQSVAEALRSYGVDAQLAEQGRSEENVRLSGRWNTALHGLVDVSGEPIKWVNVTGVSNSQSEYIQLLYGIPDNRLDFKQSPPFIRTICKKSFPIFGKPIDVRWEGRDQGTGILGRLRDDTSLNQLLIQSHDLEIHALPKHKCWVIAIKQSLPTPDEWECYQKVAQHLLACNISE